MGNRGRAFRDEAAMTRIDAAWAEIAHALDLDFGEPPPRRRDRDEEATVRLETWAERLEMVAAERLEMVATELGQIMNPEPAPHDAPPPDAPPPLPTPPTPTPTSPPPNAHR